MYIYLYLYISLSLYIYIYIYVYTHSSHSGAARQAEDMRQALMRFQVSAANRDHRK